MDVLGEAVPTPISEADPCGPDLRWDPAFMSLLQEFENSLALGSDAVVDGKVAEARHTFDDFFEEIRKLCTRTKDLRILAVYVEASWRAGGLPGFAKALTALVAAVEAWPDPDQGIHPRADEEDGDLSERGASLGKMINRLPTLAATVGWGEQSTSVTERLEVATALRELFENLGPRLAPAFGDELPTMGEAWGAIRKLLGQQSSVTGESEAEDDVGAGVGPAPPQPTDAWDTVERAMELMAAQNRHSPAVPLLQLLASWRSLGIVEISEAMRMSGVSLEQLLDSVKKQLAAR